MARAKLLHRIIIEVFAFMNRSLKLPVLFLQNWKTFFQVFFYEPFPGMENSTITKRQQCLYCRKLQIMLCAANTWAIPMVDQLFTELFECYLEKSNGWNTKYSYKLLEKFNALYCLWSSLCRPCSNHRM